MDYPGGFGGFACCTATAQSCTRLTIALTCSPSSMHPATSEQSGWLVHHFCLTQNALVILPWVDIPAKTFPRFDLYQTWNFTTLKWKKSSKMLCWYMFYGGIQKQLNQIIQSRQFRKSTTMASSTAPTPCHCPPPFINGFRWWDWDDFYLISPHPPPADEAHNNPNHPIPLKTHGQVHSTLVPTSNIFFWLCECTKRLCYFNKQDTKNNQSFRNHKPPDFAISTAAAAIAVKIILRRTGLTTIPSHFRLLTFEAWHTPLPFWHGFLTAATSTENTQQTLTSWPPMIKLKVAVPAH